MSSLRWILALCLSLAALSCQTAPADCELESWIAFRAPATYGDPGAVAWRGATGEERLTWFGEPQWFRLHRVAETVGYAGHPALAFEIAEKDVIAFGDFTEGLIGQQMAVEVGGEILSAPIVQSRLPGAGVLQGGGIGFSEEEMQRHLDALQMR